MKPKSYPIRPEHIDTLMKRFIYLNQLRVGVISIYFAVVAALFAVWRGIELPEQKIFQQAIPGILLIVGILVYVFDLRCRARSSRTAQGIRARVIGLTSYKIKKFSLRDYLMIDEDSIFSMIVMVINSGLVIVLISTIVPISAFEKLSISTMVFIMFVIYYSITWRKRVFNMIDEWPDDDLLENNIYKK